MKRISLSTLGLLTAAEAGRLLDVTSTTLCRWARAGLLPVIIAGDSDRGTMLFRRRDLDSFTPPLHGRPPDEKKGKKKR